MIENCSLRHLTMSKLKVENAILIWQAGTNSRAFQTGLAVQEVNFFSRKPKTSIYLQHIRNSTESSLSSLL